MRRRVDVAGFGHGHEAPPLPEFHAGSIPKRLAGHGPQFPLRGLPDWLPKTRADWSARRGITQKTAAARWATAPTHGTYRKEFMANSPRPAMDGFPQPARQQTSSGDAGEGLDTHPQ
jgi:hypothetical protein